ncbi:MAG TPA: hypothetical protein VEU51_07165 [Candidatus Acidoferrales bacterium]|nr:hypothetical protein [Candidatus Acidoferrales bacterium]
MLVRKMVTVALAAAIVSIVAVLGSKGTPLAASSATAVASPAASPASASSGTTSSMSAAEKEKVLTKLKAAKRQDKQARKDASPSAQAAYDAKIKDLNRLIDKLNKSEDVKLSEVDAAVTPPDNAAKSH